MNRKDAEKAKRSDWFSLRSLRLCGPLVLMITTFARGGEWKDAAAGIRCTVPDSFEVTPGAHGLIVSFASPTADGDAFRENVGVMTEKLPAGQDADSRAYADAARRKLAEQKDLAVGEQTETTLAGRPAFTYTIATDRAGQKVRVRQIVFVENGTAYLLVITALDSTADQFENEVKGLIESLKVE